SFSDTQQYARMNVQVVPISTVAITTEHNSDTDGSYTGGAGKTWRFAVCASADGSTCNPAATLAEWAVVSQPSGNTSLVMPSIVQDAAANFRVIEVKDPAAPVVAAFARNGQTYTSVSFTTTHPGTAQYLIAGLSAGIYTVSVNGSVVAGSPFTVVDS